MRGITHSFLGLPVVASSRAMRSLLDTAQLVSHSDATVLIEGESGTGKEVVARALHCFSKRSDGPWVNLNCAALPDHLIELELFGADKSPDPAGMAARPGMFELADGGTLFLDEIGDLEWKTQAKLLRVLDGHPYFRVGGTQPIASRVRFVAATNQNLDEAVAAGRFRADLFHRLAQFRLCVPPLRNRVEDIAPIAEIFAQAAKDELTLTEDAKRALEAYAWPGNVRELRNVINMCAITVSHSEIHTLDLPERIQEQYASVSDHESDLKRLIQTVNDGLEQSGGTPGAMLQDMEKRLILQVLHHTQGHQEKAAHLLGISRRTLHRKLKQYDAEGRAPNMETGVEVL
jgi:DNA-binding NtrC family response regulator